MKHFGINIVGTELDNRLNEDNFSILGIKEETKYPHYKTAYSWRQPENMLIYDLNMRYFKNLDSKKFNKFLSKFIIDNGFVEIKNLGEAKKMTGIYIMVLDDYKQVYIGQAVDIKSRIMKHWRRQIPFRNISQYGAYNSKIAIDSFRALDTTRIYVLECEKDKLTELEIKYINNYREEYLCNIINPSQIENNLGYMARRFDIGYYDNLVKESFIDYLYYDHDLDINAHECSHAHRIAFYLEKRIRKSEKMKQFSVDVEYNRIGEKTKSVPLSGEQRNIRPDIIVHKRGSCDLGANEIVIEVKRDAFDKIDEEKIKNLCINHSYKYKCGYCLLLTGIIKRYCPDDDKWVIISDESSVRNKYNDIKKNGN